ncbi:MAG: hypothetical protein J6N15_03555 [Ruminiclostridium sp.]|nr:hypothetical protein [Ruminiclostridium sp.]
MDKLKLKVNERVYFIKTDKPEEVLHFAKNFDEQIKYLAKTKPNAIEAELTAYAALLLMGDSLSDKRSEVDQALIDELNGKIEVLEERIDTLTGQITEHKDKETAASAENRELKARCADLERRLADVTQKQAQIADAYNKSQIVLNDTKAALASNNKIIANLNKDKFTEVAANEALRNELEVQRDRLEAANKQIAELNGKITKMEINSIAVEADGTVSANEEAVKKLRSEKEDLEIELAIANEEIEKLKAAHRTVVDENESAKKIAEYERTIRQLESRSNEIDKLRSLLAETEQAIRHKVDEKEDENNKLRNILKNYENSYGLSIARKEEEIIELQQQVERLKDILNMKSEDHLSGRYIQTTFDAESEAAVQSGEAGVRIAPDKPADSSGNAGGSDADDGGMSKL